MRDYGVVQTRRFARQYKKLHDNIAGDVDQAVADVASNPESGERKKASSTCSAIRWRTPFGWSTWKPSGRMRTSTRT